jgi:hypothetical protein
VVRHVDQRVGIEPGIAHDPIDRIIDHGRDAVDAAQPTVERELILRLHAVRHRMVLPDLAFIGRKRAEPSAPNRNSLRYN